MSTQPPAYPQSQAPAGTGVLLPPVLDYETPGEPAQYRVPGAHRRPYGEMVRDKRGRGYYQAVMALSVGVVRLRESGSRLILLRFHRGC